MKIGIVTLIGESNYGNLLQSYALQTVLERMGHEVVVLNRRSKINVLLQIASLIKCLFRRFVLGNKEILIANPLSDDYAIKNRVDNSELIYFVNKYINRTRILRSEKEMISFSKKNHFDAYIVGSDQIWRESYTYNIEESFLSFVEESYKGKRIAYAGSFGSKNNPISLDKLPKCISLFNKFNAVSVREKNAIEFCKNIFNINATFVLDPTMLLCKEDYCNFFITRNVQDSKGDLMVYVLDENERILEYVKQVSEVLGLTPFNCYRKKTSRAINYDSSLPSVECWIRSFYDTKMVITDSFHACVFSILFNKPFVCIGNKERGMERFDSLLSAFGLKNRLVDITESFNYTDTSIEWSNVNLILEAMRKDSMNFLLNALN